jgi:hypothetical protein
MQPKVFVSYSHDSDEHIAWVLNFCAHLQQNAGIRVIVDEVNYERSLNWSSFMLKNISKSDFVLVICTKKYRSKSEDLTGNSGVSRETIINLGLFYRQPEKFIPIVRELDENENPYIPLYLEDFKYYDFSKSSNFHTSFQDLSRELWKIKKFELPEPAGNIKFESKKVVPKSNLDHSSFTLNIEKYTRHLNTNFDSIFDGNVGIGIHYVEPKVSTYPKFEKANHDYDSTDIEHDFFQFFTDDEQKTWLLLGDYGSGKTTFCFKLCRELVRSSYQYDGQECFPILLFLKKKSNLYPKNMQEWFIELINENLRSNMQNEEKQIASATYENFIELTKTRKVLLILDGLDEISIKSMGARDNYRNLILFTQKLNCKLLITSRVNYFPSIQSTKVTRQKSLLPMINRTYLEVNIPGLRVSFLKDFNSLDINNYLRKSKNINAKSLLIQIEDNKKLRNLASRPIFLNLLSNYSDISDVSDININILYRDIIFGWVKTNRELNELDEESMIFFLEEIAFFMFIRDEREISVNSLKKHLALHFESPGAIRQVEHEITNCSFLVKSTDQSYSFSHNTFIEFLVASKLNKEISDYANKNFYIKILTDPINQFLMYMLDDKASLEIKQPDLEQMIYIPKDEEFDKKFGLELGGFYIDKYPVTNKSYKEFLASNSKMVVPFSENRHILKDLGEREHIDWYVADVDGYLSACEVFCWNSTDRSFPLNSDLCPVTYVSYYDAWAYARWMEKELPSYFEWIKAASWSFDTKSILEYGSLDRELSDSLNFGGKNTGPISIQVSDENTSINGCIDMFANACEWTCQWHWDYESVFKIIAGGSWHLDKHEISMSEPHSSLPNLRRNFVSFRPIWRDPVPG